MDQRGWDMVFSLVTGCVGVLLFVVGASNLPMAAAAFPMVLGALVGLHGAVCAVQVWRGREPTGLTQKEAS